MNPRAPLTVVIGLLCLVLAGCGESRIVVVEQPSADPLPSWNEGATKQAVVDFVEAVTKESGPDYVAPSERIATFDNDGTLWTEQPMYPTLFMDPTRCPYGSLC